MKKILAGKTLDLFISKNGNKNRINQNQITLNNSGILNDKFYGKNIQRSVLITSKHSYKLAIQNNIDINYGQLGENILMDYNPYHLLVGSKIQIGDVVLEISQECTLCKSLAKVDTKLPKLLKNDRGIFAKVVKSGSIKKGDNIYILS